MPILVILPIFLIILAGWMFKKFKIAADDWTGVLNKFVYYVSLPAIIAVSLWDIDFLNPDYLRTLFHSFLIIILFSLAVFIFLSFLKINRDKKAAIFLTATTGNTVYMGFPLVELSYGKISYLSGALIGTVYLIVPILISIFVIRFWHSKEHKLSKELYEFFKNPLVISVFFGVVLGILRPEYALFSALKKSLSMLGATASPAALFALGGFLYGKFLKKNLGLLALSSFLKTFGFALFIIALNLFLFKIPNLKIFVLQSVMPVAVTTFIISEKFKLDSDLVANSILVSTILSFVIVPFIVFIFS